MLDLVVAEGVVVLHDAAGVDQALPLDGDVLEVLAGQLGLEFEDGGSLGHGDGVGGVRRGLDLEGDLSVAARLGVIGHGDG